MSNLSSNEEKILVTLLTATRWAALATARDNEPLASWVAAVADVQPGHFLLHLSQLALHTRYVFTNPRASLTFSQADDDPTRDPQTLARVSLQGTMVTIPADLPDYQVCRARYLDALPTAEVQFGLADFHLMRFEADSARFVPGFGRAHRLDRDKLKALFGD